VHAGESLQVVGKVVVVGRGHSVSRTIVGLTGTSVKSPCMAIGGLWTPCESKSRPWVTSNGRDALKNPGFYFAVSTSRALAADTLVTLFAGRSTAQCRVPR